MSYSLYQSQISRDQVAKAAGREIGMMRLAGGPSPNLDEVVRRLVRSFRVLVGIPDDVERITATIDRGLTLLSQVAEEIVRVELLKAEAELLQAEAVWMCAYAELHKVEVELAHAEALRELALAAKLREKRLALQEKADAERDKALTAAVAQLQPLLESHAPEHASALNDILDRAQPLGLLQLETIDRR